MKILLTSCKKVRQRAWALLAVMTLAGVGLMLLASVMKWSNQNSAVTARNNEYFATSYAAEAATEKVLANMSQQYQNYSFSAVDANMSSYAATVPTSADDPYWTNYTFSGGTTPNSIIVTNTAVSNVVILGAPYTGLTMVADTYQIIANAQNNNSMYHITSTVGQEVNLGVIPLFQFAIFYQNDMEIAPGGNMYINGAVHGNQNIYLNPQAQLTFSNTLSGVGTVNESKSPLDPSARTMGTITFDSFDLSGVDPLNLPVGTNNTGTVSNVSQNVYAILQPPAAGQTPTSDTGKNLLYNQADMIIMVSNNNTITVTSGAGVNSQATVISNNQWQFFLNTNGTFYDQRDSLNVNPVVLNVSNLVLWSATNSILRPVLSSLRGSSLADVESIYIDDQRSTSNLVITTNVSYITNLNTNSTYPAAGTFLAPVVTNWVVATNTTYPGVGTYIGRVVTNTTTTTSTTAPTAGNYVGTITTNTTKISNASTVPSPGTYTGTVTTNKVGSSKTYTYNQITGYTYNVFSSYSYEQITGYLYSSVSTNTSSLTNVSITSQPGIVLSNGAALPPSGLSIATPDPAYVVGNWNVKLTATGTSTDAGSADTSYTHPSGIYADAITVLSGAWNPANSALSINSRNATSDTVNAAFLTGNVPSNGSYYSGGVENFPRFLENWSGQTFTYNGSMVAMFSSQIATAHWPGTGTVYNPPTRNWAFDKNFSTPSKQPPLQPQITTVQRNKWVLLAPKATSF